MSYLARARFFCLLLLSISFLFLNLSLQNRIQTGKNFLLYLASPGFSSATKIFLQGEKLSQNLIQQLHLNEENRQLKEKLKEYVRWETSNKEIEEENKRLRTILQFQERTPQDFIVGQIIIRDTDEWYNTITINRGSVSGMKKDLPVIAIEGEKENLLGRIIEVSPNTSKILLLTDSLSAVVGYVPRSKVDGVIEGQGNKKLQFKYILPEADLKVGDLVVTSGLGGIFPAGIPIGEITKIEEKKFAPYKEAILIPRISFSRLREVLVYTE